MNLYDIITRKAADFDASLVSAEIVSGPQGRERTIVMSPGASIRLVNADQIQCLECFPHDLGWTAYAGKEGKAALEISIFLEMSDSKKVLLNMVLTNSAPKKALLNWPVSAASSGGFDMTISNKGAVPINLSIGMAWSARPNLISTLKGRGVEIGPGFNPCVLPTPALDIRYIENITAEDWGKKYGKSNDAKEMEKLWEKYIICSAEHLELIENDSLDFIFSNHVFEHLVNPLGVLQNWHKKLKIGGVVTGIVPDARYTFDLRQPISEENEIFDEFAKESFALERSHYSRWCLYTVSDSNIDDLIKRKYSVHAKYYSPESFKRLLNYSARHQEWREIFVQKTVNGKDFGFSIKKR